MHPPPLLLDRAPGAQIALAVVVPALFGLLTGFALGWSEPLYIVLSLLGVLGGLAAGYEHAGSDEGTVRGFCGGSLFGTFILLGHEISGEEALVHLPEPHGVLVVITTVLGMLFGAIGGAVRARHDLRRVPTAA